MSAIGLAPRCRFSAIALVAQYISLRRRRCTISLSFSFIEAGIRCRISLYFFSPEKSRADSRAATACTSCFDACMLLTIHHCMKRFAGASGEEPAGKVRQSISSRLHIAERRQRCPALPPHFTLARLHYIITDGHDICARHIYLLVSRRQASAQRIVGQFSAALLAKSHFSRCFETFT